MGPWCIVLYCIMFPVGLCEWKITAHPKLTIMFKNILSTSMRLKFSKHLRAFNLSPTVGRFYRKGVHVKAHANGPNIVGQQHPTLLGPTTL